MKTRNAGNYIYISLLIVFIIPLFSQETPETPTAKPSGVDIANQLSLIPEPSEVEQALANVDPDDLTPRQALEELYRLKKLL